MVAFNFMPRFYKKIRAGEKLQTIRKEQRAEPGQAIQLYQGMRTKNCRKIRPDVVCESVYQLRIHTDKVEFLQGQCHTLRSKEDLDRFAREDGFEDWQDLSIFFKRYDLPFTGYLHRWRA